MHFWGEGTSPKFEQFFRPCERKIWDKLFLLDNFCPSITCENKASAMCLGCQIHSGCRLFWKCDKSFRVECVCRRCQVWWGSIGPRLHFRVWSWGAPCCWVSSFSSGPGCKGGRMKWIDCQSDCSWWPKVKPGRSRLKLFDWKSKGLITVAINRELIVLFTLVKLSNPQRMQNSVSKCFGPAMKTGSSRQFHRDPATFTYMSFKLVSLK